MEKFRAFVIDKQEDKIQSEIKPLSLTDLPEGDVTIKVAYSSINYKDGLATLPKSIVRNYPMVPGIDLAGTVVESSNESFKKGDEVIVTSYELGISHFGGFSEYARVPAEWVVPLPEGLTIKEAMILGTAGFTAALSILRLEENGLTPKNGKVLVTGATGGVGSIAVDILSKKGYEVAASSGKKSEHGYLKQLGAKEILSREEVTSDDGKPLRKQLFAAAVDPVGGKTLEYLLSATKYGGSVAVSGLTGGAEVAASVYPFILRGINLLGIDSVYCPMEKRLTVWERLASDMKPANLDKGIVNEVSLEEIPSIVEKILNGEVRGRTLVKM
ncbi:acryloyl-CoA reductase [Bacillus idriensis]|uniref:Acryloyl-CoA reductase n=1 Tax=Metabacillus idriensis TaxID=324768 RepID=A0A6I2M4M8_9BACI|nr:acryloyl-CoA reductase [Metabacillus idriensis]MRX53085.1 acryloyl-CoA reductase [Metabacillus idriensis]